MERNHKLVNQMRLVNPARSRVWEESLGIEVNNGEMRMFRTRAIFFEYVIFFLSKNETVV